MDQELFDPYLAPAIATRLVFTAMGLIDTFTAEQRSAALIADFSDPRRLDWDIIPKPDRTGVPLHQLDRHQKVLTWDLIRMCVPLRTFTKILAITQLETVLRDYEYPLLGPALQSWRSPDSYFLTIFGRPGFEDTWTLRFLGHHVCINVTVVQEKWIFATPMALGAQPIDYDGVLRPLHDDEQLGFDLVNSLDPAQRAQAIIHTVSPADFVTRQVPHVGNVEYADHYDLGMGQYRINDTDREATKFERQAPSGISASTLTSDQLSILRSLVACYLERLPQPDRLLKAWASPSGLAPAHFAWAGDTVHGRPHYFRIHTSKMLIEAVNSVNSGNHLHTVVRDLDNDFGAALLAYPDHNPAHPDGSAHLRARTTSSESYSPSIAYPAPGSGATASTREDRTGQVNYADDN